jgi:hypothetical protein
MVVASSDIMEALDQVAQGGFDVGLIDAELSGVISGPALARRCAILAPRMKILLITPDAPRIKGGRIAIVPKPQSLGDVRSMLHVVGG